VSIVIEIPSHHSLTDGEKQCLYYDAKSLELQKERSRAERRFDRSFRRVENTLEENMFFRNHLGELVHPAHFRSYVDDDLPHVSRDTVVPGYYSFDKYMRDVYRYEQVYAFHVREKRFRVKKSKMVVESLL
jgi:hypothetical protein